MPPLACGKEGGQAGECLFCRLNPAGLRKNAHLVRGTRIDPNYGYVSLKGRINGVGSPTDPPGFVSVPDCDQHVNLVNERVAQCCICRVALFVGAVDAREFPHRLCPAQQIAIVLD